MVTTPRAGTGRRVSACILLAGGLLAGGCSQGTSTSSLLELAQKPSLAAATQDKPTDARSDLQKATEYWGKEFAKNPRDAQTAVNFARNLKALGEKQQALAVLQQASIFHGQNRALNSEYGRLALEFDQISTAQKLLEQADDPVNPDWRVISARGTVLAKQGLYRDAIAFYERARVLAPNEPSVLNNLALAHTMEGHADKAEPLLKQAAAVTGQRDRVNQNLALVLGLQGKYDEAKVAAAQNLPAEKAADNVDYVRRLVDNDPRNLTTAALGRAETASEAGAAEARAEKPTTKAKVAEAKLPARPQPTSDPADGEDDAKAKPKAMAAARAEVKPKAGAGAKETETKPKAEAKKTETKKTSIAATDKAAPDDASGWTTKVAR